MPEVSRTLRLIALIAAIGTAVLALPAYSYPESAPLDRDSLRAIAAQAAGGNREALLQLRRAGVAGVSQVRDVLVDQNAPLLQELVAGVVQDELNAAIREQLGLIYHGQFAHLKPLGAEAVTALLAVFKDEDASREHRSRAAIALGDMGESSITGELVAITRDMLTERWLEREAGYLMARLGDRSYVEPLILEQQRIAERPPIPGNLSEIVFALTELAEVNYRIGDYSSAIFNYEKKRAILEDLIERLPPEMRELREAELALLKYNLACSLSLAGRIDEAFRALDAALLHPDVQLDMVRQDGDLRALRASGKYAAWLAAKEKSPTAPKDPK